MRIRKHAKISQLAALQAGIVLGTMCQLNQSPWDVMNFSPPSNSLPHPPPSQSHKSIDINDVSEKNGRSQDSILIVESLVTDNVKHPMEKSTDISTKACGRNLQCQRDTRTSNLTYQQHLVSSEEDLQMVGEVEANNNEYHQPRRPKRSSVASSSLNSNEFYYYSGFGPHWGKNRCRVGQDNGGDGSLDRKGEMSPTMLSRFIDEDLDYTEDEGEEGKERKRNKRARKSVKVRSLKSLS